MAWNDLTGDKEVSTHSRLEAADRLTTETTTPKAVSTHSRLEAAEYSLV